MDKGVEIEILGHKAKIYSVSSRLADGIFYKDDLLMVSIDLDESVDGLDGFSVRLPVKRYAGDEFLAAVKAEAEKTLPELLHKNNEEREKNQRAKEKKEALDLVVGEICSEIGLEK